MPNDNASSAAAPRDRSAPLFGGVAPPPSLNLSSHETPWRHNLDRYVRTSRLAARLLNVPHVWVIDDMEESAYQFLHEQPPGQGSRLPGWVGMRYLDHLPGDALGPGLHRVQPGSLPPELGLGFMAIQQLTDELGCRLGSMVLADRRARRLSRDQIEAVQDLARIVAAELHMEHRCAFDPLTSLYNRGGFLDVAGTVRALARGRPCQAALLYLDLDDFKAVNDRHGHAQGDHALRDFADQLRATFRRTDVMARIGGDEFLVLAALPQGAEQADGFVQTLIGRLHARIDHFNAAATRPWRLSASAGQVLVDLDSEVNLHELMDRADAIMYADKQRRRTRRR